jgi:hypothetical protein
VGAKQKFSHYPEDMTHNDFDYHDDIIKPLLEFLKAINFDTAPTPERPVINFPDSLFMEAL